MLKRIFDIVISLTALIVLLPVFLIISIIIFLDSRGGVFYLQNRVGKNNKDFRLIKFRTMKRDSEKAGLLTIGNYDERITRPGRFLRKYKLDELPQLINVLCGSMSLVGPRPEVRKYVEMYDDNQLKVLQVKPGLTDYASIEYINESEILAEADNPEEKYIKEIMPQKLSLNLHYIKDMSLLNDLKILFKTIGRIL